MRNFRNFIRVLPVPLLRRLARDESGAIALIFGLSLLPVMGLVGISIDYNRASQARMVAATAADAAALETVKAEGTLAQRRARGEASLRANLSTLATDVTYRQTIEPVMRDGVEVGIAVEVTGNVPTAMMGVMGVRYIPFRTRAEATTGKNELVDVAFVLDTTASMTGSRLASLKDATTRLLTDFETRRGSTDQIHVAVVPFAQYVNIGMSNRNQSWLDVPSDYQVPVTETCNIVPVRRQVNCRQVPVPATPGNPNRMCSRDGVPYSCPLAPTPATTRTQCDTIVGPDTERQCTRSGGNWMRWTGCVGSRAAPFNAIDGNYANRIPGLLNTTCGQPLRPLSNDLSGAKSMINGLTANSETYLPSGLFWGWASLSTQVPFPGRGSTEALPVSRYMILVTDGQNTKSQSGNSAFHNGSNGADADAVTLTICRNMAADRASGIKLYTIAFEVTDLNVKALLRTCSQLNGGEFFDATNADALVAALRHIGSLMTKLRLTK